MTGYAAFLYRFNTQSTRIILDRAYNLFIMFYAKFVQIYCGVYIGLEFALFV